MQEQAQSFGGEAGALEQERLFLALVLVGGFGAKVLSAEKRELGIFLKKLREVKILPAVVTLLVEIHGADAHLPVVKIGRQLDHEIVATHVTEQPDKAALVEFHEFFGDPDRA